MAKNNISNMTIEELVGGASTQDIAAYFRNVSNTGIIAQPAINNNASSDSGSESTIQSEQRGASNGDMRKRSTFSERAIACFAQLTVTDWILIVIALLLFINILVTVKYHD